MTESLHLIIVPDEDDGALVLVDGTIDGRPYRFLLDTGAATSSVESDEWIDALPGIDASGGSGVFAGMNRRDLVTLPRLAIGPIEQIGLTVDRVTRSLGQPIASLIGMDVLHAVACLFRFDQQRVDLDPPASDRPPVTLPLHLDRTLHPYVDVGFVGSQMAHAVWDTGSSMTVVDQATLDRNPDHFELIRSATGTDSAGDSLESAIYRMGPVTIGGVRFAPHLVAAVDLGPINAMIDDRMDMILGYTTLSQATWWLDFPGRRWAVSRHVGPETSWPT